MTHKRFVEEGGRTTHVYVRSVFDTGSLFDRRMVAVPIITSKWLPSERCEYYRIRSAQRYLRRFPHSHPAEQRMVEGLMAKLNTTVVYMQYQERFLNVLRAYVVQRMVKQVDRELVHQVMDELLSWPKQPDDGAGDK